MKREHPTGVEHLLQRKQAKLIVDHFALCTIEADVTTLFLLTTSGSTSKRQRGSLFQMNRTWTATHNGRCARSSKSLAQNKFYSVLVRDSIRTYAYRASVFKGFGIGCRWLGVGTRYSRTLALPLTIFIPF